MLIINGKNSDGKGGGGIQNHGTLTVVTVTVRQNESTFTQFGEGIGGGISNLGSLNLYQVRLRENKLWGLATNGFAVLSDVDVQQNEDGGINSGGGYLRVEFSSIENNKGPGVEAHGTLDMVNVTISGNDSGSPGNAQGGLTMNGFASLKYVTIYANGLSGSPGSAQGIRVTASPGVTLYNSIVYGNGNGNAPQCGSGVGVSPGVPTPIVLIDGGYNVIEDGSCSQGWPTGTSTTANPKLNPLAEGFLTFTNALSLGSSAIDRVPQGQCGVSQDQRESNRPVDGNSPPDGKADCDAGAYEFTP
jgi:hypothetical protein